MHIIPIASGKGGVGKSLVASNLAIALAQAGKSVVLADLDLGASNIHVILGHPGITVGIGTFLSDSKVKFQDIVVESGYKNLRFVPGDAEIPGMANVQSGQKNRLLRNLLALDADYLIMDLGAGTSFNTMDFFLSSGSGIIVTAPTLTATLNAYLFLKNAVFRILTTSFKRKTPGGQYLDSLKKESGSLQRVYIPKLIERLAVIDPENHEIFQRRMALFRPRLILNMLDDPKDAVKASKIRRSCREYLGVDLEHLGIIYRDHFQDIALQARLPVLVYKPQSILSQAVYRIADKVLQYHEEDESLLDIQSMEESYLVAGMEAEIDYEARAQEMENLLHCGALTKSDLIETVKSQQYEISSLKRENSFIKAKLVEAAQAGFSV